MFEVKSLEELYKDGVNLGPVILAVINHDLDPQEIQNALFEWRDGFLREKAVEIQILQNELDSLRHVSEPVED